VNRFTLIPWERCSLGGFIGSGTSGDVYSATYASTQAGGLVNELIHSFIHS